MKFQFKHIVLIGLFLALYHCASETKHQKSYEIIADEKDADGIEEKTDDEELVTEFEEVKEVTDYEDIDGYFKEEFIKQDQSFISQKLQDFYDLLALQNKHPEFKEDVALQLKNYTKDSLNIYAVKDVISIDNIKLIAAPIEIDTNTTKVHIQFSLKSNTKTSTERLFAYITKKETIIDGEVFTSSKVIFSKD